MKWTPAVVVALLALGLSACQKPKQVQPDTTTPAPTQDDSASTTGLGQPGAAAAAGTASEAQRQALQALQTRNVVYFEYDSSEIKPEFNDVVTAHARYLVQYTGARVRLEGHADERGSREYNIALGQRRADAIKRMMTLLGAQDSQVETVSFGEEKPRNPGHDEGAWTQNRRGDIVHAGE